MPAHISAFVLTPWPAARFSYVCSGQRSALHKRFQCRSPQHHRFAVLADLGDEHSLARESRPDDKLFRITELEDALDTAVAAEQYTSAAGIRDELELAKSKDCVQILAAVLNYYDAFNCHSMDRIEKVWRAHDSVVCQHPLSPFHAGYDDVMDSFQTLFTTLPSDLRLEVSDVRIAAFGPAAFVTCLETPDSSMLSTGDRRRARRHGLLATSIFEKIRVGDDDRFQYLMVHHVSTPVVKGLTFL